jgi:hypothetical protein
MSGARRSVGRSPANRLRELPGQALIRRLTRPVRAFTRQLTQPVRPAPGLT